MTDFQYKTMRKFYRDNQTATLSIDFNLKQHHAFCHQSFTETKTESKHYLKPQKNQNNKTFQFSESNAHRKTQSVGKHNEFGFPQIKISRNKKAPKKGGFLEIWLNEALDCGQSGQNQRFLTNTNDQTLGALKSYGLDKLMLKSKNISQQTIFKIYKKLYIYSKGLGATFQQIGKLARSNSKQDSEEGQANQMIEIFWKAFAKLIQSQRSFETSFQVIEKKYIKIIKELKQKLKASLEEFESMGISYKSQKRRLQKQIQQSVTKFKQLQTQYLVTKATLEMTDKSLDQEIDLRLKFQEKINAVYSSYDEIKAKYLALIEEVNLKKQNIHSQGLSQDNIKATLESTTAKCCQLEHLLELQKSNKRDLEVEIYIKKEEAAELQRELLKKQQSTNSKEDFISEQNTKNKLLLSLLNQSKNQLQRFQSLYQEKNQINQKFQSRIFELSELNDRLFKEKYQIHNQAAEIKQKNHQLQKQLELKCCQLRAKEIQLNLLQEQLSSAVNQMSHEKHLKMDLQEKLQIKTNLLRKQNQTLTQLKEVKDRHERLQTLAQYQKRQAIDQKLTTLQKINSQQLQIKQLQNQIAEQKLQSSIIISKLTKQKQMISKKCTEQQDQLEKKDKIILSHLSTIELERISVFKKEKEVTELKFFLQAKEAVIQNLECSKVYFETNQPLVEQQLKRKQDLLKQQVEQFIQNLGHERTFSQKIVELEVLLLSKNNQIHLEIQAYKKLSSFYKAMLHQKQPYIHPMIYEDALALLRRQIAKIQTLQSTIKILEKKQAEFEKNNSILQKQRDQNAFIIENLTTQSKQLSLRSQKLQTEKDKLIIDVKNLESKNMAFFEKEKKIVSEIDLMRGENQNLTQKLLINEKLITDTKKEMEMKEKSLRMCSQQKQIISKANESLKNQLSQLKLRVRERPNNLIEKQRITQQKLTQTELPKDSFASNFFEVPDVSPVSQSKIPNQGKQFTQSSKQIVEQLILQNSNDLTQKRIYFGSEEPPVAQKSSAKEVQRPQGWDKSTTEKKKMEKKNFQKALKLTFMRR